MTPIFRGTVFGAEALRAGIGGISYRRRGLDYRTVSWAVARFGRRAAADRRFAGLTKKAALQIQNPDPAEKPPVFAKCTECVKIARKISLTNEL